MGLAQVNGLGDEAKRHLRKIRKFSRVECDEHIASAFDTWNFRNNFEWDLDLSIITDSGIAIKKNVTRDDREDIVSSFFGFEY